MEKETWNKLKVEVFLKQLYPEELYLWESVLFPIWRKAIRFIELLLKNKVSLNQIEVNDWNSSAPKVYVDKWEYRRFAPNDYKRVLRHLKRSNKKIK